MIEPDILCDGPLDGLVIPYVASPTYLPTPEVLQEYPKAANAVYRRRTGGRLYLDGSKWEANS